MITCGWCNTHYTGWKKNCDNCGGPMPPPPGSDPGPEPPDTPRKLPKGFAFRTLWSRNLLVIIGGVFFGGGALMSSLMLMAKTWAVLFPAFFVVGGFFMFLHGRKVAKGILRAFRHGKAVAGKVYQVSLDTTQSINERHPWRLVYHFPVDGQNHEGVLTSYDSTVGTRGSGQPVWVLYVEDDLDQNTLYPPLR
jgi:hypothetical protein